MPNCGNCLMEKVEIVELDADGTCPECGVKYPKERKPNEAKYTPGPWALDWRKNECYVAQAGPNDIETVAVLPVVNTGEQTEANARLIAAAPEMYEALEQAMLAISENKCPNTPERCKILKQIRTVLAKVEGK